MEKRGAWLLGCVAALTAALVGAACSGGQSPASPALVGASSTDAKPGGTSAYQLNLSHIECVTDGVEIHFVLLHTPENATIGQLSWSNDGVAQPPVASAGRTGNVVHFNIVLDSAGEINVTSASVQVNGFTVNLHNPGEYAGDYSFCGNNVCAALVVPPNWSASGATTCLDSPLGSESAECAAFGLAPDGKDAGNGGASQQASKNALVAIVKDGSVGCNPGQQAYTFYTNVTAGQALNFHAISHITYCKCPEEPNPLRQ
jgi:hypothetical protein